MSYGISINNNQNRIILDSTYKNFQVYAKGTFYTNADNTGLSFPPAKSIPNNAGGCVALVRPLNIDPNVTLIFSWDGISASKYFTNYPAHEEFVSVALEYILLKPISEITSGYGSYGLEIRDESGALTFSSNYPNVDIHTVATKGGSVSLSTLPNKYNYVVIDSLGLTDVNTYTDFNPSTGDDYAGAADFIYDAVIFNSNTSISITTWGSYHVWGNFTTGVFPNNNYIPIASYNS